ncbi:SWI/SNF-related matrix-associated actin-dependent regulator of chromatin subfamily A-like protein 1 isoform X2 [Apis mellifera]|uniref:SWI/SNF-related matrix-associated actin-dependent regulator of chromatin subfamily A-like protein 1 isoform X2 n=1 Tax=Apis mellifera TaxID=7460 RepID=A0A7M7IEA8_APIME|nr:SWI/SNF-related matrix-associated actin-dependent regulator of chromatin subfamily A-like protein 1 isoform X2 [Apis mellifera]|eukprot:XP_016766815.2 SWI/SNF-related matrix-associated actin-dependent regulator of chromatin subfamily A-like protein 1 isoform X2 [Apis mellifera]
MNYSQEEIEKKRLLAIQRKKQAQLKNSSFNSTNIGNNISSNDNILINENKSNNSTKVLGYGQSKYINFKIKFGSNSDKNNAKFNKQKERFNPISAQNFFGQKSSITGKCYMISDTRFILEISSYFPPLIETLKTISSRSYDMKTKNWSFHLKDYETLMEKIINFKSNVQITGLPKIVLQIFRKNDTSINTIENIDLSDIDPKLLENIMPFQREGICYGISKGGRCMIADDMGLGKTIQALGIAHYFRKNWPLLIIVPSSMRYQWAEAIYTFLPSVPTHYIYQFTNTKDVIDDSKIVITTYDLLVRAVDTFQCKIFGFVILDESHVLKSSKTARFKAAQCIVSQARHVVLLSGTPVLSRPIELYSQINLIMPNFMGYHEYGIRYCAGEKTSFGWDFTGSSNMQELHLLLKRTCIIRRLKNDILNQLPIKKRFIRIDGKTNPERRKYEIDKFQNNDSYIAAVLSITAANAGITLTAAQLVIFAELFWNPGILCQAEDRVHRIGQYKNVIIQYLVAKHTADDYLWPLIQKKMNVLNEVGLDQDFSLKNIDYTTQGLNSKQKTLNFFINNEQYKHEINKKIVQDNENATKNISQNQSSIEEFKELLNMNEEDFDFCDWDNME